MKKDEKIKNIIENSGNDFHLRIAAFLRSQGWNVQVSPYYNDPATNKPREIDIIALKNYPITTWFHRGAESLSIRLFIECKYIKDPQVLWFESKNGKEAKKLAKDNPILHSSEDYYLEDTSTIPHKTHHYLQGDEVMKLGSKAGNSDPLYEAMNGSLNAMIFYKGQHSGASHLINFPIIAVDSFENLHKRDLKNKDGYQNISENFQMEVDYSFSDTQGRPTTKYFLLDIISENNLKDFLEMLEKNDILILQNQLGWQLRQQRDAERQWDDRRDPFDYG